MKIDKSKLKKSLSEVPNDCKQLIEHLKACSEDELVESLKNIKSWNFGKCELYHWIDVLDYFDSIMERCVHKENENQWTLPCNLEKNEKDKNLLINIISFTSLLIEHSFSKHVYSSMEHLTTLLASSDMQIVLAVLNLLYVFSKRSNFISRLNQERKLNLLARLNHLADSWGGKENGFGLAECCQDLDRSCYPISATTLHFEFYSDESNLKQKEIKNNIPSKSGNKYTSVLNTIHIDNVDQITDRTLAEIMEELIATYNVPKDKQMLLFTHLRLAHYFSTYRKRLQCVQARLQALSIIVYSNSQVLQENFNILYNGFIEELVEVLEIKDNNLLEIKAAAIRTLTSVIHLDHSTKLTCIIDITGASSYHGFLPCLVRNCIQALIDNDTQQYTLPFATALFSFLYHLANYENGGEALVSCGMIDSLLKVVSWKGTDSEHITFVTRAVRVIDLITNLEMAAFHTHADLNVFINRLEYDVDMCRKDQPFEIEVKSKRRDSQDIILTDQLESEQQVSMEIDSETPSTSGVSSKITTEDQNNSPKIFNKELQCYPQKAAVLKSILNFLKKAIQDAGFSDSIRHLMDGSLPKSLKHIISNAEYYGASLFMLATDVVTAYVFQEPSLLSSLQENGLTDVILHALLVKDIPPTKEVLTSLPNVFSALCLNSSGLEAFKSYKPFDRILRVLISPEYLPAIKRRRSNDPMGDTPSNLGTSMDELMRHLPSLRLSAITAIINLLKELCKLGSDPDTVCSSKLPFKVTTTQPIENRTSSTSRPANANDGNSSGDDEEEEDDIAATPTNNTATNTANSSSLPNQEQCFTNPESSVSSVIDTNTGTASSMGIVENLNQNSNSNTNTNNIVVDNASSNNQIIVTSIDNNKQQVVPLVDYILHVMKFLDAILSNNNTEDHCREFVQQKGLEPLLNLHQLPNLPIDFPLSAACVSLGNVCKSIFCLSQEKEVLKQGLVCLQKVLHKLKPLHNPLEPPGGSVLLEELIQSSELYQNVNNCDPLQSAVLTPLSHSLSAAHSYITMFINLSRCSQNEIRAMCISHWGSELGQTVLKELGLLYTSLVWESTILLAFCSENNSNNINSNPTKFGQSQLERLAALSKENSSSNIIDETAKEIKKSSLDSVQTQVEQNPTASSSVSNQMDIDESTQFNVDESTEKTKTQVEVAQAIINYRSRAKSNKLSPETRQIKTLLTSASRLGRALAELFNLLVKLSVNCPSRQRRNHSGISPSQVNTMIDSVANSLTKLVCNALNGVPSYSPTPKFRLTFYICCVGFTSPLLFDDKKYPYHLMLHNFVQCGAQDAFFETFKWALTQGGKVPIEEGLEHPNLPDGVGEFLDSWLMLLEKMVNPKTILETTHVYLEKSTSSKLPVFDPIKYLLQIHKKTFDCIMHLWNKKPLKVYGEHISESILVILCHLLRGEKIIRNKITKDLNENANNLKNGNLGLSNLISSQTDSTFPRNSSSSRLNSGLVRTCAVRNRNRETENSDYNRTQIQQLVEMGFEREAAVEAFMRTNTLEQAAEYLLERPNASDWDMTENDQFLRAIEISLNENSTDVQPEGSNRNVNVNAESESNRSQQLEVLINNTEVQENVTLESNSNIPPLSSENDQDLPSTSKVSDNQATFVEDCEPLSTELMNSLTNNLLSGCLNLLDTLPQTVHRVCDILLAVSQRNGDQWTKKMLLQLIDEIFICVDQLLECSKPLTVSDRKTLPDWAMQMNQIPEASKAASRIHLFSLLFEEKKNECAQYVEESGLINNLIALLKAEQDILTLLNDSNLNKSKYQSSAAFKILTPKWLAPVILLIDLYDKAAIASKRKAPLLELPKRQWKYFDERNGKWTPYVSINNKIIDDAYCNGENLVRFFVGRKKYCVQFPIMLQVNEESVNYRPIMFVNSTGTSNSNSNSLPTSNTSSTKTDVAMEVSEDTSKDNQQPCNKKFKVVKELDSQQNLSLIEACVCFLSLPVDVDALQAVMRLILRITRDYDMAWTFTKLGGIKSILKSTQKSEFPEFISLSTLIIRHVFEDSITLKQTMEKVLRSLWQSSMGNYKEMHYQLRIFGPAACRNSKILTEIAENIFRIQFNSVVTKKEDEDLRLLAPNATQILKVLPPKNSNTSTTLQPAVKDIIKDLLNALIIKSTVTDDEFFKSLNVISQNMKIKVDSMDTNEVQASATEQMQTENSESNNASNENNTSKTTDSIKPLIETTPNTFWRKEDLLFTQSVIMRILAELVRSYNVVAKLITDHQYTASQSEFITEDCSAIAFILDNLLPNNQFIGDRDSPALARLLIVALASSAHCPEAQIQLISEIKAALARALSLNESNEKHLRIQALTGIINTMIDIHHTARDPGFSGLTPLQKFQNLKNFNSGLHSIIFRKGLFIDLARVSHSLDLSSPHMAVTINTVLKPLETLSRAIHHPTNQMFMNQKKPKASNNNPPLNNTLTGNNQNQSTSQLIGSNALEASQTNQNSAQQEENAQATNQQETNNAEQISNLADTCSTPLNQASISEDFNLLNSLLMDVNEPFDNQPSAAEGRNNESTNALVNDSIDTVSVVEPMIEEAINTLANAEENYNSGDQHQQDVTHVININTLETETDDSEEIDEEDDDDEDADDEDDEDVVESEDISPAEDEEDEDEEDDHGEDDDDDNDDEEIPSFGGQGQEIEDLFLRYTVSDEMLWDLEESSHRLVSTDGPYRYNDYVQLLEGEQHTNGADASQPTVPPAPGTVSAVHPLLTRNSNDNIYPVGNSSQNQFGTSILPRNFRTNRQRLHRNNTIPQNQPSGSGFNLVQSNSGGISSQQNWHIPINNIHAANVHHSNPPVMLQRLLGPSSRQNLLQFTSAIQPARIVFTSNDYQLFTTSNWNEFGDSNQLGTESNDGSMLSSVATAITRWTEESKVLDGDSMHDCIANLKPEIISHWEKNRDEEMNERKEKRKELIEKDRKVESMRPVSLSANRRQAENIENTSNIVSGVSDPLVELFVANSQRNQQAASTSSEPVIQNDIERDDSLANVQLSSSNSNITSLNVENSNTTEAEQMEITSQPNIAEVSENLSSTNVITNQTVQQEDVVEMNCTETISEQEMEISNVDLNIQAENSVATTSLNTVEINTPEPNNVVEIPNQSTGEDFMSILRDQIPSASQNNEESSAANNEQEIPEGIDPSFLAALPENIRQEVIAEQLRLQRLQQQRATIAPANNTQTPNPTSEISPEFLAALPPGIQEELIAQHNTEQRTAGLASNPDSPVDPTDFIQALPLPLRRQVLADIDDSLLALLPTHLVNEAQVLREELEARHRHIQERFLTSHATHALSRILRSASVRGALPGNSRYTIHHVPQGSFPLPLGSVGRGASALSNNIHTVDSSNVYLNVSGSNNFRGSHNPCYLNSRLKCKQLLDNEALSCLLILLFVDEPKLNIGRLHRVIRNLCNHAPTRQWIIQSLLSIMEKAREGKFSASIADTASNSFNMSSSKNKRNNTSNSINSLNSTNNSHSSSWLSISMDAALGCRTDVFQIHKSNNFSKVQSYKISINPQAARIVCRHVLDTLISLAKSFPYQFLPDSIKDENKTNSHNQNCASTSSSNKDDINNTKLNKDLDFWDVLVKLDSQNVGKSNYLGKNTKNSSKNNSMNTASSSSLAEPNSSHSSPTTSSQNNTANQSTTLTQIISLLAHPIIKKSSLLTDRLLRLLSLLAKTYQPAVNTTINTETTNNSKSKASSSSSTSSSAPKTETYKGGIDEEHLKLAVDVLTSKSCSEEGLEDATSLLLKLSQSDPTIRGMVLKLLLQGARELGQTVCTHIYNLSEELKKLNLNTTTSLEGDADDKINKNKRVKGVFQDRFTKTSILINGSVNTKHNPSIREVQLPSMAALTCKTSSQSFFLRILKVIIQLRESIKASAAKNAEISSTAKKPETSNEEDTKQNDNMEIDNKDINISLKENKDSLSNQLALNDLWDSLSNCLLELANAPDHHAVLVLQPAVEAFFFVHACEKDQNKKTNESSSQSLENRDNLLGADRETESQPNNTDSSNVLMNESLIGPSSILGQSSLSSGLSNDTQKFLQFAETHKVVLNQILRQSTTPLSEGPFSVLVDHTRVLDFDVKRRYFRTELDLLDEGGRREDLAVHVRREHVFEDSFRELYRRSNEEWKNRFYIVFENEEGQDAGGLLREWYTIISREIFNPMYALFCTSPGDRVTYMINSSSHCNSNHLQYFKFVGRVIAKAIYDNKLLDCYFTRSFYKHILGKSVKYTDMESEDYTFYQSLAHFLEHDLNELDLDLTFSIEVQEFGVTEVRDLKENGRNIPVTEENKHEYVRLVCQEKMTYSIKKQLSAFLEGFYEIIPKRLISIFNEQELELLISGLPNIDIDDLKANTEYHKYQSNSLQIQWFWRALRSFDQADRAKFLQFVTGTSKVPLQGFASLEGMNGIQKFQVHREDSSTDRLPSAHTCFNQLDLPVYETFDKLKQMLLKAIHECSEGFGFV